MAAAAAVAQGVEQRRNVFGKKFHCISASGEPRFGKKSARRHRLEARDRGAIAPDEARYIWIGGIAQDDIVPIEDAPKVMAAVTADGGRGGSRARPRTTPQRLRNKIPPHERERERRATFREKIRHAAQAAPAAPA
jgi:hypothetical protein